MRVSGPGRWLCCRTPPWQTRPPSKEAKNEESTYSSSGTDIHITWTDDDDDGNDLINRHWRTMRQPIGIGGPCLEFLISNGKRITPFYCLLPEHLGPVPESADLTCRLFKTERIHNRHYPRPADLLALLWHSLCSFHWSANPIWKDRGRNCFPAVVASRVIWYLRFK